MSKKKRPYDKVAISHIKDMYPKVRDQRSPFKLIALELNRLKVLDGGWTDKEAWAYAYHHCGDMLPRKNVRRGFRDKGVPEECTIPEGCVSVDEVVRLIEVCLEEAPPDKNPYEYAAAQLNHEGIHITTAEVPWQANKLQKFYLEKTKDPPTNRLRSKFPEHQVWTVKELVDYVWGLKEVGFTNEAVVEWLNRERILHNRWKLNNATWNKDQLSSLMSTNKDQAKKRGRQLEHPRKPAVAFVRANPEYKIMMPKDVVLLAYRMKRKGFEWTVEQLALYLNRNKFIRGNYSRGSHEWTGATIANIFHRMELKYSDDREPDWVEAALNAEQIQEELEAEKETEPEPLDATTEKALTAFAALKAKKQPQPPATSNGGLSVKLPRMQQTTDQFTAEADVQLGAESIELTLKYTGAPDALLAALMEKLFDMKLQF